MTSLNALHIALIALGGALGGAVRYAVSGRVAALWGEDFPWGTLVVNVSGALLIGVLAALLLPDGVASLQDWVALQPGHRADLWAALVVGSLGSYTTVSSFSLHNLALAQHRRWWALTGNIAGSMLLCLLAAAAGWQGTRLVVALLTSPAAGGV